MILTLDCERIQYIAHDSIHDMTCNSGNRYHRYIIDMITLGTRWHNQFWNDLDIRIQSESNLLIISDF